MLSSQNRKSSNDLGTRIRTGSGKLLIQNRHHRYAGEFAVDWIQYFTLIIW